MATDIQFDANNFRPGEPIDNNQSNYLQYTPGTTFRYNTYDAKGVLTEVRTVTVTNQTKVIDGVTCIVVTDVVKDATTGALIESTKDYFAQDKDGNVWYFGEDAKNYNYDNAGNLISTDTTGSWLAGKTKLPGGGLAAPGVVMEATPKVGDTYNQENAPGVAEDQATVTSLTGQASVPAGTFTNLLVTLDLNPLDTSKKGNLSERENKYYAAGIGEVYSQTYVLQGNKYVLAETEQLVSVTSPTGSSQLVQAMASFGATPSALQSPVITAHSDQHTLHNFLAAPGHHT
jgi:hypothetical protein